LHQKHEIHRVDLCPFGFKSSVLSLAEPVFPVHRYFAAYPRVISDKVSVRCSFFCRLTHTDSALATWVPLIFILLVAAVRDGVDDFYRWTADRVFNMQFGAIRVGQIIRLREGGLVPCDCVLLERDVFVETTLLDGETDWKEKRPLVAGPGALLEVPEPSANVSSFEGRIEASRLFIVVFYCL
jgi:hypothetical protein